VQRGIWVPTQHLLRDQGKLWKTLIVLAGHRTFRMQLTSSQQSGIKSANPNISPYSSLLYLSFLSFFFFFFISFSLFFLLTTSYFGFTILYVHMIWISTKPYKTLTEGLNAYVNKHTYKHTYIHPYLCFSSIIIAFHRPKCNTLRHIHPGLGNGH
jgi:hypothetical protein